jgi:multimeric flavodoxin WrbA
MHSRHLLIVMHSKTGRTARLAQAVQRGATHPDLEGLVEVRMRRAAQAGPDDLRWAHGVLLGTPENFGYMSGALKDFLDRTFYEVEGQLAPLPYAAFISAGNDGSGALRAIRRIVGGYPMVEARPPLVVVGEPDEAALAAAEELGMAMAFGLDAGLF